MCGEAIGMDDCCAWHLSIKNDTVNIKSEAGEKFYSSLNFIVMQGNFHGSSKFLKNCKSFSGLTFVVFGIITDHKLFSLNTKHVINTHTYVNKCMYITDSKLQ